MAIDSTDFFKLAVDLESADSALHGRISMLVALAFCGASERDSDRDETFNALNADITAAFVQHDKRVDQALDEFKQAIAK
jgi:hypothetical protein